MDAATVGDCIVGTETLADGIIVAVVLMLDIAIVVLRIAAVETVGAEGETFAAEETMGETIAVKEVGIVTETDFSETEVNDMLLLLWEVVDGMEEDKLDTNVEGSVGATTGGTWTFAPVATEIS